MRLSLLFIFLLFGVFHTTAQEEKQNDNAIPNVVDSLYREDQFYVSLSFNLITNQPQSYSQNGFSGGLNFGFIRDMPINKRRNVALGIGLGHSINTYNSNLFIGETTNGETLFQVLNNDVEVDRNRFSTSLIEMPVQLRWRTSTPTSYTFWRIYGGMKFSYIYSYKARFIGGGNSIKQTDIPELNKFRYAATLTLGHGGFNAFVQYDLNTLFDNNAVIDSNRVNLQPIKFGIEFYIL